MSYQKGFTLIELLVVIAIIGLMSSIVLASLSSARNKARDVAIKQDLKQMAILMALNYDNYGSYSQLQVGWVNNPPANCNAVFSGIYASKARVICSHIISNGGEWHSGVDPTIASNDNFSVMAYLPGVGQYACIGSSGANSDKTPSVYTYWVGPGCYGNP